MAGRLQGKRVLLTGTAGGQGAAAQRLFAEHGARVAGCDVQPGPRLATAAEWFQCAATGTGSEVDPQRPGTRRASWSNLRGSLGGIDVLYENAAGFGFAPFAEMELSLWRHVLRWS